MSTDELHDEPTPVEGRLIDAHRLLLDEPEPRDVAYNHTIFCQTSLPYRNPGDDVREVTRKNGAITVEFTAGKVLDRNGDFAPIGLPYGPRARLVLIHLMTQAVLNRSPRVELEDSLTAFARSLGLANGGRDIRTLREQMRRMAACSVHIGVDLRRVPQAKAAAVQLQAHLVEGLQLYMPKEPRQRVLWPSYVELNHRFFDHLLQHAVPLDPRALEGLKHSAAALDFYQYLAQRLHRVKSSRGTLVPWRALHQQLGGGSRHVTPWKANFLGGRRRADGKRRAGVLSQVLAVYPAAAEAVEVRENGLHLRQAEPPVPKWGYVQQRRASLGGGEIRKRLQPVETLPPNDPRHIQADENNPACPGCGHRATLTTWEARGDCALCGTCLDGSNSSDPRSRK